MGHGNSGVARDSERSDNLPTSLVFLGLVHVRIQVGLIA